MHILAEKSALLCPRTASDTFAPMLVPLRSNCFERTNYFFSADKCLCRLTILTAKSKDLFSTTLSFIDFLHSAFCIMNYALAFVTEVSKADTQAVNFTRWQAEAVLAIELGSFSILRKIYCRYKNELVRFYYFKSMFLFFKKVLKSSSEAGSNVDTSTI